MVKATSGRSEITRALSCVSGTASLTIAASDVITEDPGTQNLQNQSLEWALRKSARPSSHPHRATFGGSSDPHRSSPLVNKTTTLSFVGGLIARSSRPSPTPLIAPRLFFRTSSHPHRGSPLLSKTTMPYFPGRLIAPYPAPPHRTLIALFFHFFAVV